MRSVWRTVLACVALACAKRGQVPPPAQTGPPDYLSRFAELEVYKRYSNSKAPEVLAATCEQPRVQDGAGGPFAEKWRSITLAVVTPPVQGQYNAEGHYWPYAIDATGTCNEQYYSPAHRRTFRVGLHVRYKKDDFDSWQSEVLAVRHGTHDMTTEEMLREYLDSALTSEMTFFKSRHRFTESAGDLSLPPYSVSLHLTARSDTLVALAKLDRDSFTLESTEAIRELTKLQCAFAVNSPNPLVRDGTPYHDSVARPSIVCRNQ